MKIPTDVDGDGTNPCQSEEEGKTLSTTLIDLEFRNKSKARPLTHGQRR